jgi:hypothetical protein
MLSTDREESLHVTKKSGAFSSKWTFAFRVTAPLLAGIVAMAVTLVPRLSRLVSSAHDSISDYVFPIGIAALLVAATALLVAWPSWSGLPRKGEAIFSVACGVSLGLLASLVYFAVLATGSSLTAESQWWLALAIPTVVAVVASFAIAMAEVRSHRSR